MDAEQKGKKGADANDKKITRAVRNTGDGKNRTIGAEKKERRHARKRSGGILERAGFEIVPPDGNAVKLAVKLAMTAAAVAAVLLMLLAGADLSPSAVLQGMKDKHAFTHASGRGFPIEVHGSHAIGTACVTKGTAVLTDTSFTIYDSKGREVVNESHHIASPLMENAEKFSLLYDKMGKKFMLRTLSGKKCSGETEDSIICADVAPTGRFAFVTSSELTNAKVAVYSSEGEIIHRWKSVDNKLSDIALSPSGKYVAVSGVSAKNGVLVSSVIIQQVGAKKNLWELTFEDSLIIDIRFCGNARIAAIADDFAGYIDIDSGRLTDYPFNSRILNCYDIKDNGEMALVFSENSDGRNASVVVIDDECHTLAEIDTSMTSPYVDLEGGRISLLDESEVICYNYKGKHIARAEVSADCQGIFTSQGRLLAKGMMTLADVF